MTAAVAPTGAVTVIDSGSVAWSEEADQYLRSLRVARKSPATLRNYTTVLRQFEAWMASTGRSLDPAQTTRRDVEGWMEALVDGGAKPSTQVNRFVALQSFYRWLVETDYLAVSPFAKVKRPALPKQPIPIPATDDIERLLDACRGTDFEDVRDRAIVMFLWDTGARISEVAGLLDGDIDIEAGEARVYGKGEKSRRVTFGDLTAQALHAYRRKRRTHPHRDRVQRVGSHGDNARTGNAWWLVTLGTGHRGGLTASGLADMLARRCREAKIDNIHAHQFRHRWTDDQFEAGAQEGDIMRRGGWSSRDMLDRYGAAHAERRAIANAVSGVDRHYTARRRR